MMKEILSAKNQWIKTLKKYQQRKYRQQDQKYLLEGFHLIEEAYQAQAPIEAILFTERGRREWGGWLAQVPEEWQFFVSEEVMKALSDVPAPQGMLALVAMAEPQADLRGRWLLLDNIQDPGNVGTMIRTADAAGFDGVILGQGTADVYSTKVLRSMQGSNYHLPIVALPLPEAVVKLRQQGCVIYGTELNETAVSFQELPKASQIALIMGNEGQGVQPNLLAMTDQNVYIPMRGQAESLNVAVAAGILMYALS